MIGKRAGRLALFLNFAYKVLAENADKHSKKISTNDREESCE